MCHRWAGGWYGCPESILTPPTRGVFPGSPFRSVTRAPLLRSPVVREAAQPKSVKMIVSAVRERQADPQFMAWDFLVRQVLNMV